MQTSFMHQRAYEYMRSELEDSQCKLSQAKATRDDENLIKMMEDEALGARKLEEA